MARLALAALPLVLAACAAAPADTSSSTEADLDAMMPGVDESALDRSVDPCTDFYAFACNGYIARLPADTQNETRGFSQLRRDYTALYAQIVNDATAAPRTEAETKATAFFESCKQTNDVAHARTQVAELLAPTGAAVTPKDLVLQMAQVHRSGGFPFFFVLGGPDRVQQGRHGTFSLLPGGWDWQIDYGNDAQRGARTAKIAALYNELAPAIPPDEATRRATVAVEIEATLAEAAIAIDQNAIHPLGKTGLQVAAPHIDWDSYLTALGAPADLGNFNIPGLDYFAAVDRVFAERSPADVQAYFEANLLSAVEPPPADQTASACADIRDFAFASAFVPRFLEAAGVDAAAQAKTKLLFQQIVDAFDEELTSTDFLDPSTRIEARAKLRKMRSAVAAGTTKDDFADLAVDANAPFYENRARLTARTLQHGFAMIGKPLSIEEMEGSPATVNAFYDDSVNRIEVPGGIIGGYFFSPAAANVANFAGLGTVIGHEITHGFDVNGRRSDGEGVIRDWWSPAVTANYNQRTQGLADQYSAFSPEGVVDENGQPVHLDGVQTLGENTADNGGIKIAYRAAHISGRRGTVAGFDGAQQFFVGFAQLWCAKRSNASALQQVRFDEHAPAKARVNLPLQNFDEFANAFQCKSGTPMSPVERHGVW